jgi:type II secretory pathway component HofQ
MQRAGWRALGLLVLALCAATPGVAAPAAEVYRVQHRLAEELLPYAEAALAGAGKVVLDPRTNALVLFSESPERLRSTLALLASQDRAPRSVVLEYASRRVGDLSAAGLRIDWGVATGALRVGNLIVPPGTTHVGLSPRGAGSDSASSFAGTVRILEGRSGRITTGESAALATRPGRPESTLWAAADSGLEAQVRVLGDGRVHLELRPFEARFRGDGSIQTTEAATTLVVEPGTTLVIGGLRRAQSAASLDANAGVQADRASEEQVLTITARIE